MLTQTAEILLLDEFHYLKNASHFFKAVFDSGAAVKIFASGSSSLEIHKHLKESLAGLLAKRDSQERQTYLHDLLETYILKDIKALIKDENIKAFNHLIYLLADSRGAVVSVANLAREVGLTARTIEKYLTILEQTYVCYPVPSFSTNLANELKKSKKYYLYDIGIRNAMENQTTGGSRFY